MLRSWRRPRHTRPDRALRRRGSRRGSPHVSVGWEAPTSRRQVPAALMGYPCPAHAVSLYGPLPAFSTDWNPATWRTSWNPPVCCSGISSVHGRPPVAPRPCRMLEVGEAGHSGRGAWGDYALTGVQGTHSSMSCQHARTHLRCNIKPRWERRHCGGLKPSSRLSHTLVPPAPVDSLVL